MELCHPTYNLFLGPLCKSRNPIRKKQTTPSELVSNNFKRRRKKQQRFKWFKHLMNKHKKHPDGDNKPNRETQPVRKSTHTHKILGKSLGILAHLLRMVMEPKYLAFRFGDYTSHRLIIWGSVIGSLQNGWWYLFNLQFLKFLKYCCNLCHTFWDEFLD